jgi:hypothetical protein
MKKVIKLLSLGLSSVLLGAVLIITAPTTSVFASSDGPTTHRMVTNESGLNVRKTPGGERIKTLPQWTEVIAGATEIDGWRHILSPINGWVSEDVLGYDPSYSHGD